MSELNNPKCDGESIVGAYRQVLRRSLDYVIREVTTAVSSSLMELEGERGIHHRWGDPGPCHHEPWRQTPGRVLRRICHYSSARDVTTVVKTL
ncbi:hypothetical protein L484_019848 [Morus notabilis]|uniref:Uncharacterized protein n=1 Tax=Morus notabilis TaxID=981085 RepID=W9S9W7_9ROSA|nr:hypothetical protein L484_019848 [Morus notabilis]